MPKDPAAGWVLASSPRARATVQLMKAARTKLRITAGPAREMADAVPRSRPVPMEPPTATIVICPAVSWWWRPDSLIGEESDMDRIRIPDVRAGGGMFLGDRKSTRLNSSHL